MQNSSQLPGNTIEKYHQPIATADKSATDCSGRGAANLKVGRRKSELKIRSGDATKKKNTSEKLLVSGMHGVHGKFP